MRVLGLGCRLLGCVGVLGFAVFAGGQTTPDYSGEPVVVLHSDSVYRIAADGTGTRTVTMAGRIQSEAMLKELGVLTLPYAANSEQVTFVYVRVRHPDGTVSETPATDAMEMPTAVTREAPFYSDQKEKQLPVKSMRVGDTLEWQSKVTKTKAEAPGEFWGAESFMTGGVVLSQTFELRVPKDKYVNVWSPAHKPVESVDGDEKVYRWEYSLTKPTTGPAAEAEKEAKKKKVLTEEQELDEKEGALPDIAWTTFKSWEEVGAWYRGLEGERVAPTADVKAKVAEITAGKTTEEEKIRAVYAYVSLQVRYIGVAFGVGRYQPHEAAAVLENQYGDCKDKHTLLAAMLSALALHPALHPDAVLIGAGIRFNQAVPSPAAFNHLITRVMVDDKPVWLDATAEVAPYRVLVYAIRDHAALVVPELGAAHIDRTPADLPFKPFQTLEADGSLDQNGMSKSRMVLTLRGDDELVIRAVMRQVAPSQYDAVVQRMSEGMGYGGTVSHAEVSRVEDTDTPLKVSYDYKRDKAGDWDNYRIVAQVAPVMLPSFDEKDPPLQTITLGLVRTEKSTSAMKLPEGWSAQLPEAIHAKSDYATVDQTYRLANGVLYSERTVQVMKSSVPVAEWKKYQKFAEQASIGSDQYVQLVRHWMDDKGAAPVITLGSNKDAAKLVAEAYSALQMHELQSAETKLEQAKGVNANQVRLWGTYGYLEYERKNWTAAIADYRKEIANHPEQTGWYDSIQAAQMNLKQRDAAKATLRTWAAADERNPLPISRLATLLLAEGDAAGAAAVAEPRLAAVPEGEKKDERLELLLGQAQLKSGQKDKGHATLVALLQSTANSGMMNDAAYELANAGLELPLAEAKTRAALDQMQEESRSWTMDENWQTLKSKSSLIGSTWDTLGWILFREGKADEARDYIHAAWLNRQSAEIGEHLGDLALAKGDKNTALTTYELALATISDHQMRIMAARSGGKVPVPADPPTPVEKALYAQVDAMRKAGAKSAVQDAPIALTRLRTLTLGPADGLNGIAEYHLLIEGDKVVRVTAAGDTRMPGAEDRIKKANFSGWLPAGAKVQLVKSGILNCHSGVCELLLEE